MTTIEKIEKKGYKVTGCLTWVNGELKTTAWSAEKNGRKITRKTKTELLKSLGAQF